MQRTFPTPDPVALRLRLRAGAVRIEASERDTTELQLEPVHDDEAGRRALERALVELRQGDAGAELVVEAGDGEQRRFGRSVELELTVRCPAGSSLQLDTASADLGVRGPIAGCDLHTASGDARVEQVSRELRSRSASGDLHVESCDGDARIESASGDATLGHIGGRLDAHVVSGDVSVRECGSARIETVSGDIRLQLVREGAVELRTVSGDAEVGIPPGVAVDVDASSLSGSLRSDVELADAPGDGGSGSSVTLRATSVSGDVRVRRAAAVPA